MLTDGEQRLGNGPSWGHALRRDRWSQRCLSRSPTRLASLLEWGLRHRRRRRQGQLCALAGGRPRRGTGFGGAGRWCRSVRRGSNDGHEPIAHRDEIGEPGWQRLRRPVDHPSERRHCVGEPDRVMVSSNVQQQCHPTAFGEPHQSRPDRPNLLDAGRSNRPPGARCGLDDVRQIIDRDELRGGDRESERRQIHPIRVSDQAGGEDPSHPTSGDRRRSAVWRPSAGRALAGTPTPSGGSRRVQEIPVRTPHPGADE